MATDGKTQLPVRRSILSDIDDVRDQLQSMMTSRWPFPLMPRALRWFEHEMPAVDVFERDGNVIVKAEMPGIEPDSIDVTITDGELRVSGERKEEKEVKEENYYRSERSYGHIYRTLTLPEGCDSEHVGATLKEGVLEVVIPKKEAAVGKKIAVTAG
jgi:HSP20 family protein